MNNFLEYTDIPEWFADRGAQVVTIERSLLHIFFGGVEIILRFKYLNKAINLILNYTEEELLSLSSEFPLLVGGALEEGISKNYRKLRIIMSFMILNGKSSSST